MGGPLLELQAAAPLLACLSTFAEHGLISAKLSDTGKQDTYDLFCCCCVFVVVFNLAAFVCVEKTSSSEGPDMVGQGEGVCSLKHPVPTFSRLCPDSAQLSLGGLSPQHPRG